VLCSRVFRNSVPSSIPPRERGRFRDDPARRSRRSSSGGAGGFGSSGRARFMGEFQTSRERGARRTGAGPDRGPDGRSGLFPGRQTFRGRVDRIMRDPEVGRARSMQWGQSRRPWRRTFVTFVTSQLSGSQDRPSFLPGTGGRLSGQGLSRALCCPASNVWARDGQAPARAQTRNVVSSIPQ
jgi:hypothetical protein